ncbi:tyrosine-protein phosphatase non-receptor type 23 [Cydia splendana]|uniref:tyrosine-protein phosphatase non-receptor type 23 n=1 Tax=Cydia splendana TaxID=1100963 RepID=UPI00300D92BB
MEAVPKLPLLSFELKESPETTHFGPKLKQYIADAYREDPESYSNEMHQLESLRSSAVRPSIDAAGLSALYRYFCQLRAIQSRFPMAKGQPAACTFAWKDLYANMSSPLADIRFEMACILHNIGALHTQLGASEPRTSPESLKTACTHFQNAAWAFQLVKEQYPQPTGIDVSPEMMALFQEICFAQAQECILEKSIQDTRKPSVIGAVATQVMFFYRNCLNHLGASTGSENVHEIIGGKLYNFWHRFLSFKLSYIGCIVCLYQGMNAEEQQKMGERVAFYQLAVDKLAEAQKLAKYVEPVQVTKEALTFTNDVVEGKRKAAKNENEFIYHEEVPDKDLLMDMKPVCLVKALPVNLNDPEVSGPDIFSRLIPMGAHEASSVYSEEKAKLLRQVVGQVEAKNTELTEFMSSLQLDQLEVLDSDQKIPQEIVDRCAAMNAKTEVIQTLVDSMNNLAEIISDVENSLAEIKTLIQEETLKEKEFQKVMGPRPPSIVQTELSREFHKYQEAHARTNESNQVLHKAMTLHIANLRQLAVPLDVLQSRIPTIDNIEGLDREAMSEMRRVVGKARHMQAQREQLVSALRAAVAADDVTAALLARAAEPRDQLFAQELAKHDPQVKIIETNLAAQENIINRLTSLYASYGESRRMLSDLLRKRESIINALITSYDTYGELLGKCQKGLEFYKKLSHNVNQLLTRLRGTCQVQEEERESLLAKNSKGSKAATPVPSSPARMERADSVEPRSEGSGLKLKDYLPYMKKRQLPKTPQGTGQPETLPPEAYYPESIYPTSVRPAPVGSEATDPTQMQLPDGVVMPQMMPHQYARYGTPYTQEPEPYSTPSNFSYPSKTYEKPEDNPFYSAYTPPQYSHQMSNPQTYANPYYSGSQDSGTIITDSQSNSYTMQSQANANMATNSQSVPSSASSNSQTNAPYIYDMYGQNQIAPIPENPSMTYAGHDLSANFSQMQVSAPKDYQPPNFGNDYSQTYYSVNYPQAATPNMATYSNAEQSNSNTNSTQSTDYNTAINYPYAPNSASTYAPNSAVSTYAPNSAGSTYAPNSAGSTYAPNSTATSYAPASVASYAPNPVTSSYAPNSAASNYAPNSTGPTYAPNSAPTVPAYSEQYNYTTGYEASSQSYPVYTNADTTAYSTTTVTNVPVSIESPYNPPEPNPALSQIDAYDQPIKSHVTGEALNYPSYQSYEPSYTPTPNPETTPTHQPNNFYQDPANVNYAHTYQNHPGYNFNPGTGGFDYNYGSQNSYASYVQPNIDSQSNPKDPNWNAQGVYTSAGACETVQSPSETPQTPQPSDNQTYYNTPYGYITNTNQSQEVVSNPEVTTTNYGANVNQSTYMQSGEQYNTNVTFSNNKVTTPKEEIEEPTFEAKPEPIQSPPEPETQEPPPIKEESEPVPEPSVFDLLSDIDFSVEQTPLTPQIKVPQISESAIKKPLPVPKVEPIPKPVPKEEVIQRPAKRDLFSDPSLLNSFTQEVKNLQALVDSLTNKVQGGLTLLDSKWKSFQDIQSKENMTRSKNIAKQYKSGNIAPYDDSRLTLRSDANAYINASYYKQLAPWCIPLVISSMPQERSYSVFWKAVLENKITSVVCLLSEIEMQGKFYWPTAKGQSLDLPGVKVVLDDVTCTVHWTERKLTVVHGSTVHKVNHYQISVFPAKIVCSPLILLVDKILSETFENRLSNQLSGAWLQCGTGGGRSALLALIIALVCQVRAGQPQLCDTLDAACANLYKHRTDVLEDTKFLADAYRTALFYVQGVLCSGTTSFNGEAISVPTGASVLPPVTPTPTPTAASSQRTKFSRESFEEMKQSPGLKSGDMKDPLNFLDPLWSLKKK